MITFARITPVYLSSFVKIDTRSCALRVHPESIAIAAVASIERGDEVWDRIGKRH